MASASCPIELEPRTLNPVQLTQARELAAEVVQRVEPSEASALFVEGVMHPIKEVTNMEENGSLVEKLVGCTEKADKAIAKEKACDCQYSYSTESSFHISIKEPLSAPF